MNSLINLSSIKYKAIIVVLNALLCLPVFCQNTMEECNNNINDLSIYEEPLVGDLFTFDKFYLGKNYVNEKWLSGNITLECGKMVYNKVLNYHLITQQLVWKRASDQSFITIDKTNIKEFTIKSDTGGESLFRKISIQPWGNPDSSKLFLQVLSQGYFNLFANRRVVIGNTSETAYPVSDYYFNIGNGKNERIKLSRSSLYSAVKENKKLMKKIVKANHLKIRRETGMIKAINLFNKEMGL